MASPLPAAKADVPVETRSTGSLPHRKRSLGLKLLFLVVFTLVLLEIMLRVQQKMGPFYDLEMVDVTLTSLSDDFNHSPPRDGIRYDENGLKLYTGVIPPEALQDAKAPKILFMGDSFMQGVGGQDDAAWPIWDAYRQAGLAIIPVNAAYSSYSPALFIPQARKLLPIVQPKYVVVDIDHTDVPDDYYRYEALVERDDKGQIVRVKATPANRYHTENLIAARSHALYLVRFLHKTYVVRWGFRSIDQGRAVQVQQQVEAFVNASPEQAAGKYDKEIALFERNLRELADVLIGSVGSGDKVLWVCHPHQNHIAQVPGEPAHHRLVFDAVSKVAGEKGIHYYDATPDIAKAFGSKYQDYYLKGDVIHHFNRAGLKIYARCIYDHLPPEWKK